MRAALQNAFKDYNFDQQKSNVSYDSSDAEVELVLDDPSKPKK